MQDITIGSRIALENEALELVETFHSALKQVIAYKRPRHQVGEQAALQSQTKEFATCNRESFDEYVNGLKGKPRKSQQEAVALILSISNPKDIAESVSTAINNFCLSVVGSYRKRLELISNTNPKIDLGKYYLPKDRADLFIKNVRREMIDLLSRANAHGEGLISLHKVLVDNHDLYTGERQKLNLQEQRDKSIMRKFRPLLVAVATHPMASVAMQKGTDAFVEHRLESATSKIGQIYEETFQKYIEAFHAFIKELESAKSMLVSMAEQKAMSICVAAASDILVDVAAQGGDALVQAKKSDPDANAIANSNGITKTSLKRRLVYFFAGSLMLAAFVGISAYRLNSLTEGATTEAPATDDTSQEPVSSIEAKKDTAPQPLQITSNVQHASATMPIVTASATAPSIPADSNARLDAHYGDLPYNSNMPPQIASILQGVNSNNLAQVSVAVAQIEASPKPQHGDRVAARRTNQQGLSYLSAKNYAEAIQAFSLGVNLDPADPEIINNLAFVQMMSGDYSSAKRNLFRTLLLDPQRASAWVNLGQVYAQTKQAPLAVQCLLAGYNFSTDKKEALGYFKSMEASGNNPFLVSVAANALAQITEVLSNSSASVPSVASAPAPQPSTLSSSARQ